jgi:hypothetical protein
MQNSQKKIREIIHGWPLITYLNTALGRNDSVYRRFGEGIELAIVPSHKVRFEKVATVAVVLELALV